MISKLLIFFMKIPIFHKYVYFGSSDSKLLSTTVRSFVLASTMKDLLEDNAGYVLIPGYRVFIMSSPSISVSWLALSGENHETTTSPTPGIANLRRTIKSRTSPFGPIVVETATRRRARSANRYLWLHGETVVRDRIWSDAYKIMARMLIRLRFPPLFFSKFSKYFILWVLD